MDYKIKLIENNVINTAFLKANADLLKKHSVRSNEDLIMLWEKEYQIKVDLPKYLYFNNNNALTIFLLKWS